MADISKITLPSGTTYNLKDSVARSMISGGVNFVIAWNGNSAPVVADIPAGVTVVYNSTSYTGTLAASADTVGSFYLVKSTDNPSGEPLDIYDEFVTVTNEGTPTSYFWEKLGDTKVDLSNVVTDVSLSKQSDSVIGADATFKITQPTVSLATGASAGTGVVSLVTGITSASASGDDVTALTGLGTPTTSNAVGKDATFTVTQPTVSMDLSDSSATGKVAVITNVSASTTNVKATASGANTTWGSKDQKTAVTGYGNTTSETFLKSVSSTTKKLATTTVTGVDGSTTASKVTRSSQTTAKGTGTATTTNTDWLKGVSVTNETLVIGAATLDTQTTYSVSSSADVTVPVAAASSTRVATGQVATTDTSGADVVTATGNGTSASALTGLGDPSTASVIGASATLSVTQPTIALATGATAGTGVVSLATNASGTTKYIGGTASDGNVAWNDQKVVAAVTGYASPTTDTVLGTGSTITVTPTTSNVKATASGAKTEWNSKDTVTALTNATDVTVTKGS